MKIGFIGLGRIGQMMATSLQKAGYDLIVHDIREEASASLVKGGAHFARTPKATATGVDVLFTCLPGPPEVRQVVLGSDGAAAGLGPGAVYVDSTTNSPSLIRHIGSVLGARGITVLDAPVSHATSPGKPTPDVHALSLLVGGDEVVFKRLLPLFQTIGVYVTYCGPSGSGCICKLCNNLISIGLPQLLAEVFTLGVKAGVPARTLYETISRSSGNTPHMHRWERTVFAGNFPIGSFPQLQSKDVGLALELGQEVGVPLELAHIIQQRLIEALSKGWGPHAERVQEDHAGVLIRF